MSAELFISRLEGVRRSGPGRWVALCPGHEDKSPSLSVRELDDGRILVHDFAGWSVEDVLGAVGLTFDALFPERSMQHGRPERHPFLPADVFDIARREIGVVAVIASDLHQNRVIEVADYERLFVAIQRLNAISEVAYGR